MSDIPGVERDGPEPAASEDVHEPADDATGRETLRPRRVPDRRHLLGAGEAGSIPGTGRCFVFILLTFRKAT